MKAVLTSTLACRTTWLDDAVDPLDALGPGGFAWLREGAGFATAGVAARIEVGTGRDRLASAAVQVEALLATIESDDEVGRPGTGPIAVGALPFAHGAAGTLVIPARIVGRTPEGRCWMTTITSGGAHNGQAEAAPSAPAGRAAVPTARSPEGSPSRHADAAGRERFTAAVAEAIERIQSGSLTKVVLARQVTVDTAAPMLLADVARRLRSGNPSCFTFVAGSFVGSTPELLVRREGRLAASRPMAGTVARTASHGDDDWLEALARSAKDRAEHAMVVDSVRAALDQVCDRVDADGPEVVALTTVAHLSSNITGRLREPYPSALALAGLLHPTPAVAGLPESQALATIDELEGFDRGPYAGPVGWVDTQGDGEWAVALRCARLDGHRAVLTAGAGIVAGSDPDSEWAETETKLRAMLDALGAA